MNRGIVISYGDLYLIDGLCGTSTLIPSDKKFRQVSHGHNFSLALDRTGRVYFITEQPDGEHLQLNLINFIGYGRLLFQTVLIYGVSNIGLGLSENGDIYSFNIGIEDRSANDVISCIAERFSSPVRMKSVAYGLHHVMALDEEGYLWACGDNKNGQLGIETSGYLKTFERVRWLQPCVSVACSDGGTIIADIHGKVYGMGRNRSFELGLRESREYHSPTIVNLPEKIVKVACGGCHSVFLSESGRVYTAGIKRRTLIHVVETPEPIIDISCSSNDSIIFGEGGSIYSFRINLELILIENFSVCVSTTKSARSV